MVSLLVCVEVDQNIFIQLVFVAQPALRYYQVLLSSSFRAQIALGSQLMQRKVVLRSDQLLHDLPVAVPVLALLPVLLLDFDVAGLVFRFLNVLQALRLICRRRPVPLLQRVLAL